MKKWLRLLWLRFLGWSDAGMYTPAESYVIGEQCCDTGADCGLGKLIPVVYGKTRIAPDLIWFGDFPPIEDSKSKTFDYPFDQRPFRWPPGTLKRMFVTSSVKLLAIRFE